jgi:hypothetical protein
VGKEGVDTNALDRSVSTQLVTASPHVLAFLDSLNASNSASSTVIAASKEVMLSQELNTR